MCEPEPKNCALAGREIRYTVTPTVMDIPVKDLLTATATVIAALIAAFIGSIRGARTALERFKQERGFDRRLTCYEDIAKQLGKAKIELEVAKTFQEDPNEPYEKRLILWKRVQQEYLAVAALEPIAAIYARTEVYENLVNVREAFDDVAEQTNGMDVKELCSNAGLAFPLIDLLYDAVQAHSTAVRAELGFENLSIGTR